MKKILNQIANFFKNIFGQDIKVFIGKKQKYNINKNKNSNITINDCGDINDKTE